jgi:hypothetical protein
MSAKQLSKAQRVAVTIGSGVLSAPFSYITQRVLAAWGMLDDIADGLGEYLKVHVTPVQAGWTAALLLVLLIYGTLMWWVWRMRSDVTDLSEPPPAEAFHYDDHQPNDAEAKTHNITDEIIRAKHKSNQRAIDARLDRPLAREENRRELIAAGRDLVHRYRDAEQEDDFNTFVRRHRAYLDIQPHLGNEYQAGVTRRQRTATATHDGSDYESAMFLRELARLEGEWGL